MAGVRDELLTSPGRRTAIAAGLDVLVVAVFTLIGRRTHAEPLDPAGWWETAWPFLAGLAIGWTVVALSSRTWPTRLWHGATVWIATVFGGMALRDMVGQGTALPFVIVATLFLGVTLVGWRLVLWALDRRRPDAQRPTGSGRGRVHPPVEHTQVGDPLGLEDLRGPDDHTPGRGVVPPAERGRVVGELGIRQPRQPEGD
ncbi:DUF3054 domain-containing protein [Janibacter limosus]|uniref:DUF3054 domain-containing protein n=1 Tax=Janibacter limosus TaxID=53458 RepID=UPI000A5BC465|nr:DUF3054 domain-containing protein [Janibacter limosus]